MPIQILKPEVIDQIAAGEVVERPSHLVKELVENSLDAGALRVEIEVSEGGRFIRVSDNGSGMPPEDLALACARHATSKIQTSDDIWSLHTFGFRGEALASIGAVCDLKITSGVSAGDKAYQLQCRFGQLEPVSPSGSQVGTTVEVSQLFENVPARLKFLKSEVAEVSQIKNTVKAIALAYPHVEFVFKANSKLQFLFSKAETLLQRTQDVVDAKDMFYTEHEQDGYKVQVVYSSPNTTAKTSRQIWVYVQNRWVVDKTVQAAIMESYRNLLMHGEYPIAVIKLMIPDGDVDVNIHPTKSQVKFLDQSRIFKLVHYTLRRDLEKARWLDAMRSAQFEAQGLATEVTVTDQDMSPQALRDTVPTGSFVSLGKESFSGASTGLDRPAFAATNKTSSVSSMRFNDKDFDRTQYPSKKLMLDLSAERRDLLTSEIQNVSSVGSEKPFYLQARTETDVAPFWSLLRVVGQVHATYIVAESPEALFLIDLHAAHERILFEKLMNCYSEHTMDVQNFLIPIAIDLSAEHCEAVIRHSEQLSQMGVGVAVGGPETLLVESAPSWIKDKAIVDAIVRFAEEISASGGSFTWEKKLADIFATMACHSAIRAGHVMSHEEMVSLLQQMDEHRLSSYCPHGRNVYIEIPRTKLERDFGRLM